MLLAKIKEKLFNRRNNVEIEDVEVKGEIPASIKALIESLGGTSLKMGNYILNEETGKFEWVEEVPEDYSGISYAFCDDGFYVEDYENGICGTSSYIGGDVIVTPSMVCDRLDFSHLTHSFNELDPTLKQIVEDAITDGMETGVACTQAQWNVIKALLDKSLYINYNGSSMIKSKTDGIGAYLFGALGNEIVGSLLEIYYVSERTILLAKYVDME